MTTVEQAPSGVTTASAPEKDWSTYRPQQWNFPMVIQREQDAEGNRYLHVVSDHAPAIGMNLPHPFLPKQSYEAVKIVESRPAKGDWKGVNPTWYKVLINPKPKYV